MVFLVSGIVFYLADFFIYQQRNFFNSICPVVSFADFQKEICCNLSTKKVHPVRSWSTSLIRLRRITFLAQHLQIVISGMPALAPRNDVVTFHILKGVLGVDAICNAQGTLMPLPLIGAEFLRLGECFQKRLLKKH